MRRLFIVFMILLLPLRGWAADLMAVSMANQQRIAIINIANNAINTRTILLPDQQAQVAMPEECPFLAFSSGAPADNGGQGVSVLCKGCTTCQLCMALVTGYPAMTRFVAVLPPAEPLVVSIRFTSAERASGFKPPIS